MSRLGPQLGAIRDGRIFKKWSLMTDLQVTRGVISLWTLSLYLSLAHLTVR